MFLPLTHRDLLLALRALLSGNRGSCWGLLFFTPLVVPLDLHLWIESSTNENIMSHLRCLYLRLMWHLSHRHVAELLILLYSHLYHPLLLLLAHAGLLGFLLLLDHLHLLIIVQVDLFDDHELVPVDLHLHVLLLFGLLQLLLVLLAALLALFV